ncbi:ATP-binding protein [Streptomyces flavofungini]|uniref:ATP-binding protein n=1 Tax=Streptomyces flavofungini TaxID=68200 RepID=UPI0025B1CC14|nr:ATP-binding protein [Streptomyces flavofungini]WJV47682.1 ATP-binding protein [Streptomyces flavofungini]
MKLPHGSRPARTRKPRTLRTRLVVSAVALIAVVCAVIGTVTTIALRSHLYEQVDGALRQVSMRASGPPENTADAGNPPDHRDGGPGGGPLRFVTKGPQEIGTVGAVVGEDGTLTEGAVSTEPDVSSNSPESVARTLDGAQLDALAKVARDGEPHTVDVPELGEYRVEYTSGRFGDYLVGLPTAKVTNTLNTLVVTEVSVTAAGLVAASLAGAATVGVALRPLRRVAATATRVSELPLHSGEVALHERVPDAEADARTEVGQVGAALNRMLDHVHSALHARQRSETRVRQFVADASHELRTPLASIRGYAELTRRGREETGPDTRHALGRIESEAARMTGLVEDLLLLARLDVERGRSGTAGPGPLTREPTDLSPMVVDVLSDARAAGPDHNWRLDLPDDPALVLADPARVQQVLVNLLANARTHTPPGTTVTARLHRHGPWVRLDVADDGPGIPPDLLPHVFERFARGDSSRSRAHGSTGLGLAIVQAVVAAHDGAVAVTSEPGSTVFTVHLPAYDEAGEPSPYGNDGTPAYGNDGTPTYEKGGTPTYGNGGTPTYSQTGHRLTTPP